MYKKYSCVKGELFWQFLNNYTIRVLFYGYLFNKLVCILLSVFGPVHTIFQFLQFLKNRLFIKIMLICLDFLPIFLWIFINFYKLLQIITNWKNLWKKIKNLTSKNLLKITFLRKIKNLTSMHGSTGRLLLIF